MSANLQEIMEAGMKELRALQKEQEQLMTNRGQYLTQQNENEMVKQELALLSPDAVVYKLVGPALIKQDLAEAKQNVDKRILFITTEIKRIETRSAEIEKLAERKRDQLIEIQSRAAKSKRP